MSKWKDEALGSVLEVKYGKDHKKLEDGNIDTVPKSVSKACSATLHKPLKEKRKKMNTFEQRNTHFLGHYLKN